ncbi:MAG: hypothetical protein RL685_4598 [Pseudomonadota bacterium]
MPARLNAIVRALQDRGIVVDPPRGGGSHWKARRPEGGVCFMLPAHNGPKSELSDVYVRGVARQFGLDFEEFKRSL